VPVGKKTLILEIRSENRTSTTHEIDMTDGTDSLIYSTGATLLSYQGKTVLDASDTVTIVKASSNDVRVIVLGIEVDA